MRASWLASLLTGLALALPLLSDPLNAQEPVFVVRTNADPCLNVRPSPDAEADAFECIDVGTQVLGIGTAPYWRRIRLADARTGWAAKKYLELVTAPPTPAPGEIGDPTERDDASLEVHFVDVGQGDGIWIRTFDDGIQGNGRYEGRNILIDGGPNQSDQRNQFLAYLLDRAHEGAVIDALILTHPHDDHFPGAIGILNHFEVSHYYDPGFPKQGVEYPAFRALVNGERVEGQPTQQHIGQAQFGTPDWGSEVQPQFLYSYPGNAAGRGSNSTLENNASIVLRLRYGDVSFLFMGDAEGKDRGQPATTPRYVEAVLLQTPGPAGLRSTVLKLAHHGSETSSTLPFIQAVDPRYVVASSGRRSYGGTYLPDLTTLQRYCAHNPATRIYRTDRDDQAEGRTTQSERPRPCDL